jgi:hypothetical protein
MIKNILEEFDNNFSSSSFWIDNKNYPKNYNLVKKYISKIYKEIKEEVETHCEEEYRKFIIEKNKENCDEIAVIVKQFQYLATDKWHKIAYNKISNDILKRRKL